MFQDRHEAGKLLAREIAQLALHAPIVLALPRGGIPIAAEIARQLRAPFDLILVRKIGAPENPELAVGAVVDGEPPDLVINRGIANRLGLDDSTLHDLTRAQRPEMERRRLLYLGDRTPLPVKDKTVIVTDDGAATGASMKAAVQAVRRRSPASILVALPVAAPDAVTDLTGVADRVVCLEQPAGFSSLNRYYNDFRQYSDDEVIEMLDDARAGHKCEPE